MQIESRTVPRLDVAKRVIILGGGFGGMNAAKTLSSKLSSEIKSRGAVEILLINKNNYHLFTPLLYQASTGLVEIGAIAQPIRPQGVKKGFEFLEAEVKSVDVQAQTVYLGEEDGSINYDYLVIALGSIKDDTKIEGANKFAIPLKTLEDGKRIHNRIVESFERAAVLEEGPERDAYLTFVVIGGSTGVELAGSIVDYIKDVSKIYPNINTHRDCKVYVIEAGEKLFPGGEPSLSEVVKRSLEHRGAKILLNTRVEKIENSSVLLSSGGTIRSWNVFDNSGIRPNPVLETMPDDLVKKDKGKLVVDRYLRLPGFENVFAIGDNSSVVIGHRSDGKPRHAPPTAESAVEEGKYVGRFIARELNLTLSKNSTAGNGGTRARTPVAPFRYREKGTMISIGSHTGIAKFPWFTFTGYLGWLIWRIVHLYLLATARAKLSVSFDWIFDMFGEINISHVP